MDLDAKAAIERMHALGLHSEWIASATGLSAQTIRSIVASGRDPLIPTLKKIMALDAAVARLQVDIEKIRKQ